MRRKTLMLIGFGAVAWYLYQRSQSNAGISSGLFGPGGYGSGGLPYGALSPQGFPVAGLGARRRRMRG